MAPVFAGPVKLQQTGDFHRASSLIGEARCILGELLESMRLNHLQQGVSRRQLADGSAIEVRTLFGQHSIAIHGALPARPSVPWMASQPFEAEPEKRWMNESFELSMPFAMKLELRFVRDDGVIYTPWTAQTFRQDDTILNDRWSQKKTNPVGIGFTLYINGGNAGMVPLFTGFTSALNDGTLFYKAAELAGVKNFVFDSKTECYQIQFDSKFMPLRNRLVVVTGERTGLNIDGRIQARESQDDIFYLVSNGLMTLRTFLCRKVNEDPNTQPDQRSFSYSSCFSIQEEQDFSQISVEEQIKCFAWDNDFKSFPSVKEGFVAVGMKMGMHVVALPVFSHIREKRAINLNTVEVKTISRSSVPFEATYKIIHGNTYAWFLMPVLGVTYLPNETMTDWIGAMQVDHLCDWGAIIIPWQELNMARPATPPTHSAERIYMTGYNIPLIIAMGPCTYKWPGTATEVTTDFGRQESLSFCPPGTSPLFADYPLGEQAVNLSGKLFTRQYAFQWDRDSFVYETSEGTLVYPQQTATLIQSPFTIYDRMEFNLTEPVVVEPIGGYL